jgi:hypothetical protein
VGDAIQEYIMNHRVEMISDTPGFIRDMIPVQFPFLAVIDDIRVITPAENTTVIEFVYDGHLMTWLHFCVANGIAFSYRFLDGVSS